MSDQYVWDADNRADAGKALGIVNKTDEMDLHKRIAELEAEQSDLYRTLGKAGYDKTADGWVKVCADEDSINCKHTIGTSVDEDGCCSSCGEDLNYLAFGERIRKQNEKREQSTEASK